MLPRARIKPPRSRLPTVPSRQHRTPQQAPRRHASSSSSSTTESTTATAAAPGPNKVIFSGIQPTGIPHLGNYLGALKHWVALQDAAAPSTTLLFSIVDLHALTTVVGPRRQQQQQQEKAGPALEQGLRARRRVMLAALLAVGLDPARCTIFYQSSVPAHAELMWILSCTASMGYLSRMTQWKRKLSLSEATGALDDKAKAVLKLGLFSYPVLQAADIMVHRATHVPVGDDQKQHLEFARECATNFNATYGGAALVAPEVLPSPAHRIMSLTNPHAKMSKSDPAAASRILLADDAATVRRKVARALTDSHGDGAGAGTGTGAAQPPHALFYDRAARPGVANLLELLALLERRPVADAAARVAAAAAATARPLPLLKRLVADAVVRELAGVRERFLQLLGRGAGAGAGADAAAAARLDAIEAMGAEKARRSAEATMRLVREAVGL